MSLRTTSLGTSALAPTSPEKGHKTDGSLTLPSGKKIQVDAVLVRTLSTGFFSRISASIRRWVESWNYQHIVFDKKEIRISKNASSQEIAATNEKIAKQLISEQDVKVFLPQDEDKAQKIYQAFSQNTSNWLTRASALQIETSESVTENGIRFQLLKKGTGEIDIQVKGELLGKGTYKVAKVAFSLLKNIREAKTKPVKSSTKEDLKGIQHEYTVSQALHKKGKISFVMEIHQVRNSASPNKIALLGELCDKGDFFNIIVDPNVQFSEKLSLLIDTAKGLQEIHKKGFCHLDIKPENIFIKTNEKGKLEPRIGDFGFVTKINSKTSPCGTPAFIAPEMLIGSPIICTDKMDVFSFGVMLYDAINSPPPSIPTHPIKSNNLFHADPRKKRFDQTNRKKHITVQKNLRKENDPYKCLIADCVQLDPAKRPSMKEVHKRLVAIQKQQQSPT